MNNPLAHKKIAIVCDWLTNMGGAEKVIKSLHGLFPNAPIYTTLYDKSRLRGFEEATVYTSFLQRIPFARKKHPLFLSAMPLAVESLDLSNYDIVISSSHSVAKGVITKPETLHICYCHTPMRYAWEHWELEYRLQSVPEIFHDSVKKRIHKLRLWDRLTADRVDHFLANSHFVAERVRKYYRRSSTVIYPPVRVEDFSIGRAKSYFLMVGRMIPYKRFDLVIEAFNESGLELKICGEGPEQKTLKKLAKNNVEFLGRVEDEQLKELYSGCKALIFPQIEDFGLTPVECMASGRPVIAYNDGGARESIIDGKTGILFHQQTKDSLKKAVEKCLDSEWEPKKIREHAAQFSEERFQKQIVEAILSHL